MRARYRVVHRKVVFTNLEKVDGFADVVDHAAHFFVTEFVFWKSNFKELWPILKWNSYDLI